MQKSVTMISSLPPIIGLSPYTKGLVAALSKLVKVEFLGFNHIYPPLLYPGKLRDEGAARLSEHANLRIRNTLNWYNPLGWVIEAFRIRTDLIHAQWWSYPLAPVYMTILGINKLRRKKILLTIHNVAPHERNFFKILFNTSVFFFGDEFIVHSQKNKEELQKIIKGKPIHVLPHGLIVNPLKGISREQARQQLGIKTTDKILLCFGHIRDYKGLDVALEALSLIPDQNLKLMVVGKCWEDWQKYQSIIDKYKLKDRVILKLGFVSEQDVEPVFMASDLVLLPYKHFEAQSGVGALVLPYGIPLVVSNTGGLPDYVKNKVCIVEPGNPKELSEKIQLIFNDPTLYQELKHDLLDKTSHLSWETIAVKTAEIYNQ